MYAVLVKAAVESRCIDMHVPNTVVLGQPWIIQMSAWNDDTTGQVVVVNCLFHSVVDIVVSGDMFTSPGSQSGFMIEPDVIVAVESNGVKQEATMLVLGLGLARLTLAC